MTNRHRALRHLCTILLLGTAPALLAAQQGYYRWHDDAGAEHFTQQPPAGRKSEFIATSTGKSTAVDAGETAGSAENKATEKNAQKPITGPMQALPDKDPEKCKQAQETQTTLNSHARIREKVGDDYRYLTPEEIAEQKKLAQESADVYCEPAPAK
jgi:hypothetical protein